MALTETGPGWVLQTLVTAGAAALGLAACAALAVVEWASWLMVLPGRKPGTLAAELQFETDPNAPGRRLGEPIEAFAPDGVRLAGLWHAADPGEAERHGHPRGTVLVLHGFAEDPSTLRDRMAALNGHGWNAAALDTRAHGRSGGDRGSFGGREAADVRAWVDALSASGRLDGADEEPGREVRVAVWGRSMGAAIAARAAANDPRIGAVVLEAPYVDLEVTLTRVLRRRRVPLAGLLAWVVLRRAERLAGVSLARPRPIDVAARVHVPVLVLHGTDDTLIPPEEARRLAAAFPSPAAYLEVPGAGHNSVVEAGGAALLEHVATFLDRSLALTARDETGSPRA
ncbi:MAG: alpha/beta fold hydrolase [Isosphaeraceae bacterium]